MADQTSPGSAGLGTFRVPDGTLQVRFNPSDPGGWEEGLTETELTVAVRDAAGAVAFTTVGVDVTRPPSFSDLTDIPDLRGWLRPHLGDGVGVTLASGRVAAVRDTTAGGLMDFGQATAASRPFYGSRAINGLNVLDLQGGQEVRLFGAPADLGDRFTLYLVAEVDAFASGFIALLAQLSSEGNNWQLDADPGATGRLRLMTLAGTISSLMPASVVGAGPRLYEVSFDGPAGIVRFHEAVTGTDRQRIFTPFTFGDPDWLGIGLNRGDQVYLDGAVGDVALYDRYLTEQERSNARSYLLGAYGLGA